MGTYAYKSTTDKLNDAFQHIESSGDRVLDWIHMGGRDWVVIATDKPAQAARWATGGPIDSRRLERRARGDRG